MDKRIIKFRFWNPHHNKMMADHDGWIEGIGINEALACSAGYGYIPLQFTGHQINGADLYEGDIVRLEENADGVDPADRAIYYVVVWIKEWCMFSLLRAIDEYPAYVEKGADELDTVSFWTIPLEPLDTPYSKHFLCGNIHEHLNLLIP